MGKGEGIRERPPEEEDARSPISYLDVLSFLCLLYFEMLFSNILD